MLTACPSENVLSGFALGQLPEDELGEVARHVDACTDCRDTLASGSVGDTLVAELQHHNGSEPFADEEAFARALASVRQPSFSQQEVTGKQDECEQEPPAPDSLREYQLLDKLAQGGMGTVYRALHTRLQREVALKILPTTRMQDAQAIHRFDREMQAVAKLDHPHIVRAYDAGEVDGTHFLVMELLEGTDLSTLIDRIGPLRSADACELVRQAAEGLAQAHRYGLVHRDVKPSNLMFCRDGVVKVLDLGLARLHGETSARPVADDTGSAGPHADDLTRTDQLMGTPDYMAPEQASGGEGVDVRADIFSLGATLYKLLSARTPYSGTAYNTLAKKLRGLKNDPVPPITAHRQDLPAGLRSVLGRMLAKDAKQRFATPDDLIAALSPLCKGADLNRLWTQFDAGIAAQPTEVAQRESATGERRRRINWKQLLFGAASVILLFAVLFVLRTPKGTLTVEVDESVSDRISVTARRGGEEFEITKKDEWRARLKEGQWTVELNQSDDQFRIEKDVIEIQSGKQAIVRIVRGKPAEAVPGLALAPKTQIELRVAVDPNDASSVEMNGIERENGSREYVWVKLDPQLSGSGLVTRYEGELYALLSNKPEEVLVLDQTDIRLVTVAPDDEGRTTVWLKFNDSSAGKVAKLTRANLLKNLAIVVGGRIVMAPKIRSEVSREIQISGMFTKDEALELARSLTGSQAAEFGAGQAQVFYQENGGRTMRGDETTTPTEQKGSEMLNRLKSIFSGFQSPQPAGPPTQIVSLTPTDSTIAEAARWEGAELVVSTDKKATVSLFEIPITGYDQCMLTYRFRIRTENLKASVYPEMWCRLPGKGEFFSRGLLQKARGTNDWMSLETPFYLKEGQSPDLLKLNLVFEGAGEVRMKNIEVLATPLK